MATQPQPQQVPPDTINIQVTPVQMGNEIRLVVVIADVIGICTQFNFSQAVAKSLWRAIREGCDQAETTLIKPTSPLASA